jgi:Uma2 family endonuclease
MTAEAWTTPQARTWTADELDELPDDGIRRELIDGVLIVTPAPLPSHQQLAMLLGAWLERHCPPEFTANQGVEVRFSSTRTFIPDVIITSTQAMVSKVPRFLPQDVHLAVEIVSPSSISMDRVLKPALYAAAGIPNYWRIELDGGMAVHTFALDPVTQVYRETGTFGTTIVVETPWPMKLPLDEVAPRDLRKN